MKKIRWVIILILIIVAALYIQNNWQYWTQDERQWKITCTFPKTKGHIQTVSDYRICLSDHHITPIDSDIRKMCYYYSRDEFYVQTGSYPSDSDQKQQVLYSSCLHEQGLSE